MKLTQLAAKPKLVKIEINDEETLKEFNESIEFYIWDRQPMDKYIKLAQIQGENISELISAVNEMVLDEKGKQILDNDNALPTHIMTRVIGKVVETLGK